MKAKSTEAARLAEPENFKPPPTTGFASAEDLQMDQLCLVGNARLHDVGVKPRVAITNEQSRIGVITADVLEGLSLLPSNTFNVAITSPPYYWARDYEINGQIGHEDTAEEYVDKLVEVFEEVRRVLHPEGCFYLNIGDTYYSGNGQPHGSDPRSPSRNFMRKKLRAVDRSGWGIPKKSLIGIPWQVAFGMQKKGWTLRSDIIWNRCNAFTEPTALDRPYRQYEHIFLFTKTRFYSYDRTQLPEEDVWNIPIERSKRIEHSAPFPKELVRRCILTGSPKGGMVLDPFLGSGTTLEVALELERHAVGIELSSKYTNAIIGKLKTDGCHELEWQSLLDALTKQPHSWDSWAGNRRNYRKPGTPRRAENRQANELEHLPLADLDHMSGINQLEHAVPPEKLK